MPRFEAHTGSDYHVGRIYPYRFKRAATAEGGPRYLFNVFFDFELFKGGAVAESAVRYEGDRGIHSDRFEGDAVLESARSDTRDACGKNDVYEPLNAFESVLRYSYHAVGYNGGSGTFHESRGIKSQDGVAFRVINGIQGIDRYGSQPRGSESVRADMGDARGNGYRNELRHSLESGIGNSYGALFNDRVHCGSGLPFVVNIDVFISDLSEINNAARSYGVCISAFESVFTYALHACGNGKIHKRIAPFESACAYVFQSCGQLHVVEALALEERASSDSVKFGAFPESYRLEISAQRKSALAYIGNGRGDTYRNQIVASSERFAFYRGNGFAAEYRGYGVLRRILVYRASYGISLSVGVERVCEYAVARGRYFAAFFRLVVPAFGRRHHLAAGTVVLIVAAGVVGVRTALICSVIYVLGTRVVVTSNRNAKYCGNKHY